MHLLKKINSLAKKEGFWKKISLIVGAGTVLGIGFYLDSLIIEIIGGIISVMVVFILLAASVEIPRYG